MTSDTTALRAIAERLRERAKQDRSYAVNNAIVADLLQPQMDAFEAHDGHNVYAVRMAIDHRNSAKRDNAWADDLEEAADALDHIDAQARALEEARAALEPFVDWFDHAPADAADNLAMFELTMPQTQHVTITVGDLRRARAASQSLARQEGVEG